MYSLIKIKAFFILVLSLWSLSFNALAFIHIDYVEDEWPDSRYTDHTDGTVTDNKTGLMWRKCSGIAIDTSCEENAGNLYFWHEALDLASNADFSGYADWRLPNVKELLTLTAINRFRPAINSTVFPNTFNILTGGDKKYYTSSPYSGAGSRPNFTWVVNFTDGKAVSELRNTLNYVRLVRAGR